MGMSRPSLRFSVLIRKWVFTSIEIGQLPYATLDMLSAPSIPL